MSRYSFSGHESFHCKSLWLKKGYDYLLAGNRFADIDSVAKLGVGKNMVASIRFWLRAFGLSQSDTLSYRGGIFLIISTVEILLLKI